MNQPQPIDSILSSRWILTMQNNISAVLENHAIVIDQDKIIDILPTSSAQQIYQAKQTFELNSHLLMPGLINTHGHAAMTLFRGLADDQPLQTWLTEHIWPAEQQWLSPEFVNIGSQLAMAEMIRSGITCFSDMYFFPDVVAQSAKKIGMRCQLASPIIQFPTAYAQTPDEYLHKALSLHDQYRHDALISTAFGPHAVYTVDETHLKKILVYAEELNLPIQIHLHENQQEIQDCIHLIGCRPIEKLHQLDMLSDRLQAVHMTQLTAEEINLIAKHRVHVIHCPKSNLKLASGVCPVSTLLDHGVNVAIGTDGAASNNSLSLWDEMRFASFTAKIQSSNASALNAFTTLRLATNHAAKALDLENKIGSLAIGKCADIIAIDLSHPESQPLYHPISQLIYTDQTTHVTHSWINGKLIMQNRELLTIDIKILLDQVKTWQTKLNG